jgi:hypothetical protein
VIIAAVLTILVAILRLPKPLPANLILAPTMTAIRAGARPLGIQGVGLAPATVVILTKASGCDVCLQNLEAYRRISSACAAKPESRVVVLSLDWKLDVKDLFVKQNVNADGYYSYPRVDTLDLSAVPILFMVDSSGVISTVRPGALTDEDVGSVEQLCGGSNRPS